MGKVERERERAGEKTMMLDYTLDPLAGSGCFPRLFYNGGRPCSATGDSQIRNERIASQISHVRQKDNVLLIYRHLFKCL